MKFLTCIAIAVLFVAIQTHGQEYHNRAARLPDPPRDRARLIRSYERAIYILNEGCREGWISPAEYLAAFDKTDSRGTTKKVPTLEQAWVRSELQMRLPPSPQSQIWDEQLPYCITVQQPTLRSLEIMLNTLRSADRLPFPQN